jgi:hypothetical protein
MTRIEKDKRSAAMLDKRRMLEIRLRLIYFRCIRVIRETSGPIRYYGRTTHGEEASGRNMRGVPVPSARASHMSEVPLPATSRGKE